MQTEFTDSEKKPTPAFSEKKLLWAINVSSLYNKTCYGLSGKDIDNSLVLTAILPEKGLPNLDIVYIPE